MKLGIHAGIKTIADIASKKPTAEGEAIPFLTLKERKKMEREEKARKDRKRKGKISRIRKRKG